MAADDTVAAARDAHPDAVISARGLCAGYGGRQVLTDVDLTVGRGEVRAILGNSGGGKTTLLRHLLGLARPSAGRVALLGVDIHRADEALRDATLTRVGMLFQGGALLGGLDLTDNVALPLRERAGLSQRLAREVAVMKLMQVGLGHAATMLPSELSGGMRKRAALARAMALDPEVLFCDEPGAGLDPTTAAGIDQLILDLRAQFGTTVVVVTHELASIRATATHATFLAGGRVLADGPLDAVSGADDPTVRRFFGRHADRADPAGTSLLAALGGS